MLWFDQFGLSRLREPVPLPSSEAGTGEVRPSWPNRRRASDSVTAYCNAIAKRAWDGRRSRLAHAFNGPMSAREDGMSHTQVLIAGAGPSGLMLACELARHGIDFRIVDGKSGPTRESRWS